jgi:uncharacterized protein (UPF0332 family)
MPFAQDLLEQSRHLANREPRRPRQASLRRAVSTAYYALFHLLIQEATRNWRKASQRPLLARAFEHGRMKAACDKRRSDLITFMRKVPPPSANQRAVAQRLHTVVTAFIDAQQQRHTADYDNSKQWTRTEVLTQIADVTTAFESWHEIRDEDLAQDYLVYLLVKER